MAMRSAQGKVNENAMMRSGGCCADFANHFGDYNKCAASVSPTCRSFCTEPAVHERGSQAAVILQEQR
jgi:hypothetical protein